MEKKKGKTNRTFRLDSALLREARRVLGYKTYTEAIEETLKTAVNNRKFWQTLNRSRGKFRSFRPLYD